MSLTATWSWPAPQLSCMGAGTRNWESTSCMPLGGSIKVSAREVTSGFIKIVAGSNS